MSKVQSVITGGAVTSALGSGAYAATIESGSTELVALAVLGPPTVLGIIGLFWWCVTLHHGGVTGRYPAFSSSRGDFGFHQVGGELFEEEGIDEIPAEEQMVLSFPVRELASS